MAWSSGYLVTRAEILSHSLEFPLKSGQSLSNDAYAITNQEVRDKVCACISTLPSDTARYPIYDEITRSYKYSFRYGTSCSNACSQSYVDYWSPSSSLTTNSLLYTDCQCTVEASSGYYLDSGGTCYNYECGACGT